MKQDLRVAVTKQMIYKALLHLLENKRIDKIKISELCTVSGVNRATFYRHYETLQDVLHEMQTELIRKMPHPDGPPKSLEEMRFKVESICNYLHDNADVLKVLFSNSTDEDMTKSLMALYQDILEQHRHELAFPALNEDAHQILITILGGGAYSLLKKWIMGEINKTPKELADILFSIICFQDPFGMAAKSQR